MIRIDAIWLATEPMDMRAGTETALARVEQSLHDLNHSLAQKNPGSADKSEH
ncbi:hypothetical protein HKK55_21955 [Pseudomonas sp. ADAK18]|uniref:hypothetical protein n=1 Tax=Pseudomonas sp. ADAK18 TaxID=2730848 RepID=UPI0014632128|nr:hypothetical protein [Pseudomonas sp. ADAK18]QJI31249.1 hypothetical protein HKK55_21955 [Pseudomonas sp. ADAK18]